MSDTTPESEDEEAAYAEAVIELLSDLRPYLRSGTFYTYSGYQWLIFPLVGMPGFLSLRGLHSLYPKPNQEFLQVTYVSFNPGPLLYSLREIRQNGFRHTISLPLEDCIRVSRLKPVHFAFAAYSALEKAVLYAQFHNIRIWPEKLVSTPWD